ncbi:MAG: NupC/NupG family nucleoside CNT transporter [Armatimonadetes bacterium]|nr:NupC/NupG family nucleoside CNT transporter [Armatimonadota bacterium]
MTGSNLMSLVGLLVVLGIAFLLSDNKKHIRFPVVIWGVAFQFVFALLVLKTQPGRWFFTATGNVVKKLLEFTAAGSSFVFGGLVSNPKSFGFIFAFQVLPTIIFISALMSVLYYLGIMQKVVEMIARVMVRFMKTSGTETLCCAGNIFMGQTEAPLLVKPYIEGATRSELFAIMTGGFATIAIGVMAVYSGLLGEFLPDAAGHLLAASIMSAPAALVMAKLLVPETEESKTMGRVKVALEKADVNIIDAAANGAALGLKLAANVAGMLLAFIALIGMFNYGLGYLGILCNKLLGTHLNLSFELLSGWVFSPLAWIIGIPWQEATSVGRYLGTMVVVNEFVAYSNLADALRQGTVHLSERSIALAAYALCGFANFSSIAIQIGGIGGMAPSRKGDMARLGLRALVAGSLACLMTAAIAGVLIPAGK